LSQNARWTNKKFKKAQSKKREKAVCQHKRRGGGGGAEMNLKKKETKHWSEANKKELTIFPK
jgi:hypothetical protein